MNEKSTLEKVIGKDNFKDVQNYLAECIKSDIDDAMRCGYFRCDDYLRDTVRDFIEQTAEKILNDIKPELEKKVKKSIIDRFDDEVGE